MGCFSSIYSTQQHPGTVDNLLKSNIYLSVDNLKCSHSIRGFNIHRGQIILCRSENTECCSADDQSPMGTASAQFIYLLIIPMQKPGFVEPVEGANVFKKLELKGFSFYWNSGESLSPNVKSVKEIQVSEHEFYLGKLK